MTVQLHDTGEEAILDDFFEESLSKPASVQIGLFNDSTDSLSDSSDLADITTEPNDGNYSRVSYSFGTTDFTNSDPSGDWRTTLATKTFDVTNTTGTVDSYFVVITFTSDDTGDGSATDHLLFTGSLSQSYDLSNVDSLDLQGAGLQLT